MANNFGNPTGNSVSDGAVWAATSGWTALRNGDTPYKGRQWLEIQVKGPTALALGYSNKNDDGTFTAPSDDTRNHQVIPANSVKVIAVSDTVEVYGRAVAKAGNSDSGSKVIVTEFK